MKDKEIENLIRKELRRQKQTINLIASENFVSKEVLRALGSVFTNKYAEGRIGFRYYAGNQVVDQLEKIVKERALKLFRLSPKKWEANVQALSGTPANFSIYSALVPFGGKIMALRLDMGGHLSHGSKVSLTGKFWQQIPYFLDSKTERLNYKEILKIAFKEKPKLIVTGYSAYSRIINFKEFRKIVDKVKAYLLVDMSHFAGLVAGGVYPSPFPYADVVMTTTHKTLRGPRGAIIFSRKDKKIKEKDLTISEAIEKAVFPGLQGGPHINNIAAIGIALFEASQSSFKKYAKQVVKNAKALAKELKKLGWRIVSGGTDTHLFLIDTISRGIDGETASQKLEKAGIIVNKNSIPYDRRPPTSPSGIRLGTPVVTTLGFKEKDMKKLARKINEILLS